MEMRQTPSWLPPLDISLQRAVNVISRYELALLGAWVWENIVLQELVMFVVYPEIGIRQDLRTSPGRIRTARRYLGKALVDGKTWFLRDRKSVV